MRRRLAISGLLLAALVLPAVVGVATGLHLEWSHHHGRSHHGEPAHAPDDHARLDHDHHSHPPVTPATLDGLLRDTTHRLALDPSTTVHPAVAPATEPAPRAGGAAPLGEDRASPHSSRDTLHRLSTLLL